MGKAFRLMMRCVLLLAAILALSNAAWTPCMTSKDCTTSGEACCIVGPPPAPKGGSCCPPTHCKVKHTIAGNFNYCNSTMSTPSSSVALSQGNGPAVGAVYSAISDGGHVGWACNASVSFTSKNKVDISVSEDYPTGICDVGPMKCTGESWSTHGDEIKVARANEAGNCVHDALATTGRGVLKGISYDHKKDTVQMEVYLNFTVKHLNVLMELKRTQ